MLPRPGELWRPEGVLGLTCSVAEEAAAGVDGRGFLGGLGALFVLGRGFLAGLGGLFAASPETIWEGLELSSARLVDTRLVSSSTTSKQRRSLLVLLGERGLGVGARGVADADLKTGLSTVPGDICLALVTIEGCGLPAPDLKSFLSTATCLALITVVCGTEAPKNDAFRVATCVTGLGLSPAAGPKKGDVRACASRGLDDLARDARY